jgi:hypothetical protein
LHLYLGAFVAPSVLFFAFTGALQLFSLHEAHGDYRPPAIIEGLAKVHKDQVFAVKPPQAARAEPGAKEPDGEHRHDTPRLRTATLALKVFFLFVAAALGVSTLLGVWMALTFGRNRLLVVLLLLAGAGVPVLLLAL